MQLQLPHPAPAPTGHLRPGAWMAACRRLMTAALATLALATQAAQGAVPRETAEAVVRESGLATQLGDAQRAFVAAIDQTDAVSLPNDLRVALKRAGAAAFDPAKLNAAITTRLASGLDPAQAQAALDWWRGPEGRRITDLEVAASKRLAADAAMPLAEANAAYEAATPLRQALLTALERVTRAGDRMADGQIRGALAMIEALSTIMPRTEAGTVEAARRQLEAQRLQIAESMRGLSTVLFALTYGPVDDATLASYLAFLLSPAGRAVLDATLEAFIAAWTEQAGALARSFPRIVQRGAR